MRSLRFKTEYTSKMINKSQVDQLDLREITNRLSQLNLEECWKNKISYQKNRK